MIKKILSLALILSVTASSFAVEVEINGLWYSVIEYVKQAKVIQYNNNNKYSGDIIIPEFVEYEGVTYNVTSIGERAFYNCSGLTSVTIPNSVRSIGERAFYNCSGLTSVTIPNSVTSIGGEAFYNTAWFNNQPDGLVYAGLIAYKYKGTMPDKTIIIIKDGTKGIGERAFYDCSGLVSVTISNSVTSIGEWAFEGCTNLTSIIIPKSVTSISPRAFSRCNNLSSIIVESGNNIYNSGGNCNAVIRTNDNTLIIGCKNTTIPNSVKKIDMYSFAECDSLTSIVFPNTVTSIESCAFFGCQNLKSITIPNSISKIGSFAFSHGSSNRQVFINNIYNWCRIEFLSIDSNPLCYSGHLFYENGTEITDLTIPDNVNSIPNFAFNGCVSLNSVTISNNVKKIGEHAFYNCSELTSVIIPNDVSSIGDYAFSYCKKLNRVFSLIVEPYEIKASVFSSIDSDATLYVPIGTKEKYEATSGWNTFKNIVEVNSVGDTFVVDGITYKVTDLSSLEVQVGTGDKNSSAIDNSTTGALEIPSSVTSLNGLEYSVTAIGDYAFSGCKGLTSVTIPNSITSIGNYAFSGCTGITSIELGDNITHIGRNAIPANMKLYARHWTKTLFLLWNNGYSNIWEAGTTNTLNAPYLSVKSATQTTIEIKINNMYEGYQYSSDYSISGDKIALTGLRPGQKLDFNLTILYDDMTYRVYSTFYTSSISSTITTVSKTASSIEILANHAKGDAVVESQSIFFNNQAVDVNGQSVKFTGLNPNTKYTVTYNVTVTFGDNQQYVYSSKSDISTEILIMDTAQPKVVSIGNAIVSAETNLDDEEENVGFEWRRTDWTDEFASNKGMAYLYEGEMEGYIRNIYIEKLWKYRPFYESKTGDRYYGEWVGLDPTNTSYFEPTVHTYAQTVVEGNTAYIKGYAQRGTDNIREQGFRYWETPSGSKAPSSGPNRIKIPITAKTIESSGVVMTAAIDDLSYNTEYSYVAFVTTSDGETFYGEEKQFKTGTLEGDVNGDAKVTQDDVTTLADIIIGRRNNVSAADVNSDGKVNISDLTSLIRLILAK